VPLAGDNAFVGSNNAPPGAVLSAVVALDANRAATNVTLGNGAGTSGRLNLGNFTLTLSGTLSVGAGGTGTVGRGTGAFTAAAVAVAGATSTLTFGAADATPTLTLTAGGTATTAAAGNVTQSVAVTDSRLNLGAALNLTGGTRTLAVAGDASVVDAQGFAVTAATVTLTRTSNVAGETSLINHGALTVATLTTANVNLNLGGGDAVTTFTLTSGSSVLGAGAVVQSLALGSGASATLGSSAGLAQSLAITGGSTLSLAANLNLTAGSRAISVTGAGSNLNAAGNGVSAGSLTVGAAGSASSLTNPGAVIVSGQLTVAGTSAITLASGSDSVGSVSLLDTAQLTVNKAGQTVGLTITGTPAGSLAIATGAKLHAVLDGAAAGGYALRWANPAGGDHVADLQALIAANKIDFTFVNGGVFTVDSLSSQGGFTFLLSQPVPEPALLLAAAALPLAVRRLRRAVVGRAT